jgi:hypothetical protein
MVTYYVEYIYIYIYIYIENLSLNFRLQISEYSSKILLSIYLGRSSTPKLMASPSKGTQP